MNSGVALTSEEVEEAIKAFVIAAKKIEMMAPSVPPHASDLVSFVAHVFSSSCFLYSAPLHFTPL